jgi:hypothetical protein
MCRRDQAWKRLAFENYPHRMSPMLDSIFFTRHNWCTGAAANMLLIELGEVLLKTVLRSKESEQSFLPSLSNIDLNHHQQGFPSRPQFRVPLHLVMPLLTLPSLKRLTIGFWLPCRLACSLGGWIVQLRPSSFVYLGVAEALIPNDRLKTLPDSMRFLEVAS